MKQQASIEIERPIDVVFDYTNNHVAEWSLTVVEDEVLDARPGVVGSTFRCVTEDHGCKMEFQGVVERHEPPSFSEVHLTGQYFDLQVDYQFDDLGQTTRVPQRTVVSPKGWMRVFLFLFGWLMNTSNCKQLRAELDNLKRLLEEPRTA